MKKINRNKARQIAEQKDKVKKDLRQGKITKQQAKNKTKGRR